MGANKNSRYWQLRDDLSEDGRKVSIEDLTIIAKDYFEFCYNNPIIDKETTKSKTLGNKVITKKKRRPMLKHALCLRLGIHSQTLNEWAKDANYADIVKRIYEGMEGWNIEGALIGDLNASITARYHSLADTKNLDVVDNRKAVADAFPEELEEE